MSEPVRYTATIRIEKVTPRSGTVGFTEAAREPITEQVTSISVSGTDLTNLKGKVNQHLDLVDE